MVDQGSAAFTVTVCKDGPLLVKGDVVLRRVAIEPEGAHYVYVDKGEIEHDEVFALCRSGMSFNAPFCDGTHFSFGFDGTETAPRSGYTDRAKRTEGDGIFLLDDFDMCALARFCHTDKGKIWELMKRTGEPGVNELIVQAADECPAGRLTVFDTNTGQKLEPEYPNEIAVLDDPQLRCGGPLWIRGDFVIVGADGVPYEKRSKYTLCRCGQSANKPLCDCKHVHARWNEVGK
ncbi:MAG: CDGSH iron-sulfur domain-containing protein [Eggerthellaceae bacterium]|nr:CDGSH iron-sulfur domain-containing protein [Eggerthellaceae bacterium]